MATLAVSNTFVDGNTITAAGHNTNFSDIVNYVNNRNDGTSTWDALRVTTSSAVVAILNNSSGTSDILRCQDNGTNVFTVADGGTATFSGQLLIKDGVSGSPGIAFSNSTDMGIWRGSSTQMNFSVGGSTVIEINAPGWMYLERPVGFLQNGLSSQPSITFITDLSTGIYNPSAGHIGITSSGTQTVDFGPSTVTFVNAPTFSAITASRALTTNGSSVLTASATTSTELGYVSGVTSAIQTQINTKAPTASPTFTGTGTMPNTAITDTTNQLVLGTTRTVTITAPTPASSSRTWTIPDLSTSPTFAALEGTQTFSGTKTFSAALAVTGSSVTVGASGTSGKFSAKATNGTDSAFFGFTINQTQLSTTNADGIVFVSNVSIGANSTPTYGGGSSAVMMIQDASVAPSTNPTGGGVLYSQAGALKWRGSSGTVTTIANA